MPPPATIPSRRLGHSDRALCQGRDARIQAWRPAPPAGQVQSPSTIREPLPTLVGDGGGTARRAGPAAGGLPIPQLTHVAPSGAGVYLTTTVDARGRLANRAPMRELGWHPGSSVSFRITEGAVILVARSGGGHSITRQGHLRLPPTLCHRYRLVSGARLFVVAIPDHDLIEIYSPVAVDAMLASYRRAACEQPQW